MKKPDIYTTYSQSFCLVQANTAKGRHWLNRNCECSLAIASQVPVEHRYITDLVYGALSDGLVIEDTATGRRAVAPQA